MAQRKGQGPENYVLHCDCFWDIVLVKMFLTLGDTVEISFPVFASGIDTTGHGSGAKWAGEKVMSAVEKEIILLKTPSQNPSEWRAVARVK